MKSRLITWAVILLGAVFVQSAFAYQKEEPVKQEFFQAVQQGNVAKVKEMLKTDSQLAHAKDRNGVSAVLKATYYSQKEIAAVLLATGIELNIFEAAAIGQAQRVRALLKQDSTLVNTFAPDGFFPLGLATFFGHQETVEVLLAAGADVNAVTRESMKVTPLHSAVAARQIGIGRLLLARGAKVNARQAEGGFAPMHEVAANGDLEFARLLLENGAEINVKTEDGKTPLAFAVSRNQKEMAAFLRERGASL